MGNEDGIGKTGTEKTLHVTLKWLSLAATFGMLIVVIMGATVTNTGSAQGCGRSWPLCEGRLIPEFAVATLIEFSHRVVTGAETMLILAFAVAAWVLYHEQPRMRVLAALMVGSLFLQAGMGAFAVLYPENALVLALHFGISLIAFASVLLATAFIREAEGGFVHWTRPVPVAYRRMVWGTTLYLLVVVYLGAYVRHSGFDLACQGWPLCNGAVVPVLDGPAGVVFAHRLAALVAVLLLAAVAIWSWRLRATRSDLAIGGATAFVLIIAQSLSGALVVATMVGLFSALTHAGIMALLFGSSCYLCLAALAPARRQAGAPTTEPRPLLQVRP